MAAPTTEELDLIRQLRDKVKDLNLDDERNNFDMFFVRWIRARDGDLGRAEDMLRKSMQWRKDNDVDNVLSWVPPEDFNRECQCHVLGYDFENSPVVWFPLGHWDLKKIVNMGHKNSFLRFCDQIFERCLSLSKGKFKPDGTPVTQLVSVVDVKGLSMTSLLSTGVIDMMLTAVRTFEANQPETFKAINVLNAGRVFAFLLSLIKPVLSEKTFGKMSIYTTNSPSWQADLLSQIPASALPPSLGGTNTEVQSIQDNMTASIPAEEEEEEVLPQFLEVTVPAGDKLAIAFSVLEGNSTIKWAFKTEKYDLSFAVNRDGKAYIENKRVNSHEELQEGDIICDAPGDYIFTFDNSYSRLRTKQLSYRIEILTPSGAKQEISFK